LNIITLEVIAFFNGFLNLLNGNTLRAPPHHGWFDDFFFFPPQLMHCEPENLKKSRPKKPSWNQINQFHEIFFWPNSIFCNFKNGQKLIFEQGEKFKTAKNAISRKKIWFYKFFFCLDFFLNFVAHCGLCVENIIIPGISFFCVYCLVKQRIFF